MSASGLSSIICVIVFLVFLFCIFFFFFFFYLYSLVFFFFFFSSRRRHTRSLCDWSSDVCSSDLFRACATAAQNVSSTHGSCRCLVLRFSLSYILCGSCFASCATLWIPSISK